MLPTPLQVPASTRATASRGRPGPAQAGRAAARALLGSAVALLGGGCAAQRTLEIASVPPGARVRLDDEVIGTTPLVHRFTHYGTRRVTLYLDGYRTYSQRLEIEPPWYGTFPFDFFSEVVFPVGWKDRHLLGVDLQPEFDVVSEPDLLEVLERADRFRRGGPEGPRERPLPPPDADARDGDATAPSEPIEVPPIEVRTPPADTGTESGDGAS